MLNSNLTAVLRVKLRVVFQRCGLVIYVSDTASFLFNNFKRNLHIIILVKHLTCDGTRMNINKWF